MDRTALLPADAAAERIVRHFQAAGFAGISEALIVRIGLRRGDRLEIEAAFRDAAEAGRQPPLGEHFEIRPWGHFAASRDFAAARAAIAADFGAELRKELPTLFFEPLPVLIDDALATGTRYDAMLKLRETADDVTFAALLNDPDSSFFEYLGSEHGGEWQGLIGDLVGTAAQLPPLLPDLALD